MATVLQKYFEKGWLKFGDAFVTDAERLDAGNRLYADFYRAGIVDLRIPDLEKPRVDGGNAKGTPDFVLDARSRFNKAILDLTPEQSFIVWNLVCLDKPVFIKQNVNYRHNIEVLKEAICQSLDALHYHYFGKNDAPKRHKIVSIISENSKKDFERWMESVSK